MGIKRTNATISVIKRPYLMEPEILPYQEILDSIQNEKLKNKSTTNKTEKKINTHPENENTDTNEKTMEKWENTKTKIEIKHIATKDKPEIKFSIASNDSETKLTYYPDSKQDKVTARPEANFAVKA